MKKRILTALLAVCMAVTSIGIDAQAYNQSVADEQQRVGELEAASQEKNDIGKISDQKEEKQNELSEQEEGILEETGKSEETEKLEEAGTSHDTVTSEDRKKPEKESEQKAEETDKLEEKVKPEEAQEGVLNYILMEKNSMEVPDIQKVVASLGKEDTRIADVELTYKNETTGEEFQTAAEQVADDLALFSMEFKEVSQSGRYVLKSISYTENGMKRIVQLSNLDMNVAFGVNTTVDAEPDDLLVNEEALKEIEANVIELDEDGNAISENTIENVLGNAQAEMSVFRSAKGAAQNLVVVLDPGHDDTHAGANYHGYKEQDLALKIAKYCRDELKKYSGITVYMVRETGACPYGGWAVGSSAECNGKRVEFAANKRADIYVSFHLNASPSSSANGVGVYYPNGSYRPDISQTGKELAAEIYNKLRSLGLGSWGDGLFIRNSEDGTTYPDGSLADYLGIIRRSKLAGIPAVLIEHAFLSNASDVNNFLNSDAKLKNLGVADANAIASYYGLKKKGTAVSISYVQSKGDVLRVKWNNVSDAQSYEIYRSRLKDRGYSRVAVVKNATNFFDSDVLIGKRYYYKVRPVFSDGSKGAYSNIRSSILMEKLVVTGIRSKVSKNLEIRWKEIKNASGYQIYRREASESSYKEIRTITSGTTTKYVDTVPKNNVKYYYKIRALDKSSIMQGYGAFSGAKYGIGVGKTKITSTESVSDKNLKVTWNKVKGASAYKVARSTRKNDSYKMVAYIKNGNTTSYTDEVPDNTKTYYYKILAVNTVAGKTGYSGWSTNAVSGKIIGMVTGFSANAYSETAVQLKWRKVSGASGYRIARSVTKDKGYKVIATVKSSVSSYKDTKAAADKQYYYKIEAINNLNGKSGYTEPKTVKTIKKTSINYARSFNSSSIEVNWKAVNEAYGYRVRRSTSKNGTYTTVAALKGKNSLTYRDTNVKTGNKYYYVVEVISMVSGNRGYSGASTAIAGKALERTVITSRRTDRGANIILAWNKVADATGYQISRKEGTDGKYQVVGNITDGNITKYTDPTGDTGKTYYYSVRAYRRARGRIGYASYSGAKEAWTLDRADIVKVSSSSGESVALRWNGINRAGGYRIQRSTSANSGFNTIKQISSQNITNYTDKTVTAGKVYYYRVAALNEISGTTGIGKYSRIIKVPVMLTPSIEAVTFNKNNHLEISWKGVTNASGYQIQRSTSSASGYKTIGNVTGTVYSDSSAVSMSNYYYRIRAYGILEAGTKVYSAWSDGKAGTTAYAIMGGSSVTVSDMVKYYNARYIYPASFYAAKGAPNIQTFCTILKQEAEDEGVRAEVLFAQVMLETGGMQYKGDVRMEQCNFGGLGATGNGVTGETFPNVRTGLRAQVQHLKAYASTDPLKKKCVDTRFKYVKRGTAPYVEWLSIPKNPYGIGWAVDPAYDVKLLKIIRDVI